MTKPIFLILLLVAEPAIQRIVKHLRWKPVRAAYGANKLLSIAAALESGQQSTNQTVQVHVE
jgi:hypothetical protein